MKKSLRSKVEAIKEELQKPLPDHKGELKMATKKKGKKKTKKVSKKASAKRTSSKKKGAKKKARSSEVEGVTLAELAEEADVSPQKARQKLREAGIEREKGSRWAFPEKSKALKAARKALGL